MNKRQEEIRQAAEDNCLDLSHCTYFELGAEWADQHPHWISVEDELPPIDPAYKKEELSINVLVTDGRVVHTAFYEYKGKKWPWWGKTTHWMPLPAPPKKGGEE